MSSGDVSIAPCIERKFMLLSPQNLYVETHKTLTNSSMKFRSTFNERWNFMPLVESFSYCRSLSNVTDRSMTTVNNVIESDVIVLPRLLKCTRVKEQGLLYSHSFVVFCVNIL